MQKCVGLFVKKNNEMRIEDIIVLAIPFIAIICAIALVVCLFIDLEGPGRDGKKTPFNGRGMSCCASCNQLYYGNTCNHC